MRFYQAFVEVQGADTAAPYWNKLATPKATRAEAEADIADYLACKRLGVRGYRKGAPGRTRVDESADSTRLGDVLGAGESVGSTTRDKPAPRLGEPFNE